MYRAGWRAAEAEAEAALAFDPAVELAVEQVCDPLFRFRNNAHLAAQLAVSIRSLGSATSQRTFIEFSLQLGDTSLIIAGN